MNPRTLHALMLKNFPEVDLISHEWIVVVDENSLRVDELTRILDTFVPSDDLLVHIGRKKGGKFSRPAVIEFISENLSGVDIRISDRDFTGFCFITGNGVAAGWGRESLVE